MYNIISIGIAKYETKSYKHHHSHWEIVYYQNSQGVLEVGNQKIDIQNNDIVCIPPNMSHYEYSKDGFTIAYLIMEPFFDFKQKVYHFRDVIYLDYLSFFNQMYHVYELKPQNWYNIIYSLLKTLEQYMISWNPNSTDDFVIEKFKNLLVMNIANPDVSIKDLLKEIPVSNSHFRKEFKSKTDKTPLQYLNSLRIKRAKELLYRKRMTVKNVSYSVGFKDPYYFSRVFKKITGYSPTNWLKNEKANKEISYYSDNLI